MNGASGGVILRYVCVPKESVGMFHFICEGHDGLLTQSTFCKNPFVLKLRVAEDMVEDYEILAADLRKKLRLVEISEEEALRLAATKVK